MACRLMRAVVLTMAGVALAACASTGSPRPRPVEPETRTLQQIEVDGSVRVRGGAYRGL